MPKPREYGTPIGIPGGPSEKPSGDAGRAKASPPSTERIKAELSRLHQASAAVRKRVHGSSAQPGKPRGSMPMLDRIIEEQSQ